MRALKGCAAALRKVVPDETGEISSWVLVTLMSAALIVSVWAVANERLIAIVQSALDTVCGNIGC